jgi:hypothetical protein
MGEVGHSEMDGFATGREIQIAPRVAGQFEAEALLAGVDNQENAALALG